MDIDEKEESSAITFADAVQVLSSIADMQVDASQSGASPPSEILTKPHHHPSTAHLVSAGGDSDHAAIEMAKSSFRVILKYLQKFYHKESGYLIDAHTVEGIKNIMRLVGEAAKKLDRYTQLLHGVQAASVTDLKEYRQLQEFYQRRIARKIDERVLGGWILQLTQPPGTENEQLAAEVKSRAKKRTFIDLEAVRKDLDYELFFLRKEDGSRFYNPRLVRNLRLVCDFGEYIGDIKNQDPLSEIDLWRDRLFHATASSILKAARGRVDAYLREAARYKDRELVDWINKALVALVLSANPRHLMSQKVLKCCTDYFFDFQQFLRGALTCREYQKLVVYPPKKENRIASVLSDIVYALCKALYSQVHSYPLLAPVIGHMLDRVVGSTPADQAPQQWCEQLESNYAAMVKCLKYHPNRLLREFLALLDDGGSEEWDPLLQRNVPGHLYDLFLDDACVSVIRMACPVRQGYIHKAIINEEFKEWTRAVDPDQMTPRRDSHLLVNLQDSTSWREHARCKVIEDLPNHIPYDQRLTTMTLAVDTDFYYQRPPYQRVSQADVFMQQLRENLEGEGSGCFFPQVIREALSPQWLDRLLGAIHQVFFSKRNVLSPKERMNFIELTYLFVILKALDTVKPDSLSLVCKDGVDAGSAFQAFLFGALKICIQDMESQVDRESLELILNAAPLLVRERAMESNRFHRTLDALRCLFEARAEHGPAQFRQLLSDQLAGLYHQPWWQSRVQIPPSS